MALGLTPQQIIDKESHPLLSINKNWKRVLLGNISNVQNGAAFSSKFFNHNSGLPLIRIRDISNKKTENYYSGDYSEDFVVNHNDILIGMDGDFRVSKWPGKKGLLNQRVCRLNFYSTNYHKQFLFICLQPYLNAIHEETSAVTVKHLSSRTIQAIPLPLPPLPEQRAIVAKIEQCFSELNNGIASFKAAQKKLDIYRQAVLKKAFEGELTKTWREQQSDLPTAEELLQQIQQERQQHYQQQISDWEKAVKDWEMGGKDGRKPRKPLKLKIITPFSLDELRGLPVISEGWLWVKYESLCSKVRNGISKKPNGQKTDCKIFRISAVRAFKVNLKDYRFMRNQDNEFDNFLLQTGDLLFTRYNGTRRYVGVCGQFISSEQYLFPDKLIQTRLISNQIIPSFIEYASNTFASRDFIETRIRTTAGQSGISGGDIKSMPIPVCSFQEQTQIVQAIESRLSVCDKLSDTLKQQLEKAEALRQSILKKAFEGRLLTDDEIQACQQEADWEPAAQLLARIKAESVEKATAKPRKKQTRKRAKYNEQRDHE